MQIMRRLLCNDTPRDCPIVLKFLHILDGSFDEVMNLERVRHMHETCKLLRLQSSSQVALHRGEPAGDASWSCGADVNFNEALQEAWEHVLSRACEDTAMLELLGQLSSNELSKQQLMVCLFAEDLRHLFQQLRCKCGSDILDQHLHILQLAPSNIGAAKMLLFNQLKYRCGEELLHQFEILIRRCLIENLQPAQCPMPRSFLHLVRAMISVTPGAATVANCRSIAYIKAKNSILHKSNSITPSSHRHPAEEASSYMRTQPQVKKIYSNLGKSACESEPTSADILDRLVHPSKPSSKRCRDEAKIRHALNSLLSSYLGLDACTRTSKDIKAFNVRKWELLGLVLRAHIETRDSGLWSTKKAAETLGSLLKQEWTEAVRRGTMDQDPPWNASCDEIVEALMLLPAAEWADAMNECESISGTRGRLQIDDSATCDATSFMRLAHALLACSHNGTVQDRMLKADIHRTPVAFMSLLVDLCDSFLRKLKDAMGAAVKATQDFDIEDEDAFDRLSPEVRQSLRAAIADIAAALHAKLSGTRLFSALIREAWKLILVVLRPDKKQSHPLYPKPTPRPSCPVHYVSRSRAYKWGVPDFLVWRLAHAVVTLPNIFEDWTGRDAALLLGRTWPRVYRWLQPLVEACVEEGAASLETLYWSLDLGYMDLNCNTKAREDIAAFWESCRSINFIRYRRTMCRKSEEVMRKNVIHPCYGLSRLDLACWGTPAAMGAFRSFFNNMYPWFFQMPFRPGFRAEQLQRELGIGKEPPSASPVVLISAPDSHFGPPRADVLERYGLASRVFARRHAPYFRHLPVHYMQDSKEFVALIDSLRHLGVQHFSSGPGFQHFSSVHSQEKLLGKTYMFTDKQHDHTMDDIYSCFERHRRGLVRRSKASASGHAKVTWEEKADISRLFLDAVEASLWSHCFSTIGGLKSVAKTEGSWADLLATQLSDRFSKEDVEEAVEKLRTGVVHSVIFSDTDPPDEARSLPSLCFLPECLRGDDRIQKILVESGAHVFLHTVSQQRSRAADAGGSPTDGPRARLQERIWRLRGLAFEPSFKSGDLNSWSPIDMKLLDFLPGEEKAVILSGIPAVLFSDLPSGVISEEVACRLPLKMAANSSFIDLLQRHEIAMYYFKIGSALDDRLLPNAAMHPFEVSKGPVPLRVQDAFDPVGCIYDHLTFDRPDKAGRAAVQQHVQQCISSCLPQKLSVAEDVKSCIEDMVVFMRGDQLRLDWKITACTPTISLTARNFVPRRLCAVNTTFSRRRQCIGKEENGCTNPARHGFMQRPLFCTSCSEEPGLVFQPLMLWSDQSRHACQHVSRGGDICCVAATKQCVSLSGSEVQCRATFLCDAHAVLEEFSPEELLGLNLSGPLLALEPPSTLNVPDASPFCRFNCGIQLPQKSAGVLVDPPLVSENCLEVYALLEGPLFLLLADLVKLPARNFITQDDHTAELVRACLRAVLRKSGSSASGASVWNYEVNSLEALGRLTDGELENFISKLPGTKDASGTLTSRGRALKLDIDLVQGKRRPKRRRETEVGVSSGEIPRCAAKRCLRVLPTDESIDPLSRLPVEIVAVLAEKVAMQSRRKELACKVVTLKS